MENKIVGILSEIYSDYDNEFHLNAAYKIAALVKQANISPSPAKSRSKKEYCRCDDNETAARHTIRDHFGRTKYYCVRCEKEKRDSF